MVQCKFWARGSCRNGDQCRFEHPGAERQQQQNRFAPLDRGHGGRNTPVDRQPQSQPRNNAKFGLDPEVIKNDLTTERPSWILSAYGPGKNAPVQLFGGWPREQSFEELRVQHYAAMAQNRANEAIQEAMSLVTTADAQMTQTIQNTDNAIRYILAGEDQHPNRIDICRQADATPNPFQGGNPQGSNAAFSKPNPFQSAQIQNNNSPFSKPGLSPSPFSQAAPAFQQATPTNGPFSAPSQPFQTQQNPLAQGASAFGIPPAQSSAPTSPFTTPATSSQQNPFAAASGPKPSPFSQGRATQPSPFAPASSNTAIPNQHNPFNSTQSAQQPNPFAQQATGPAGGTSGTAQQPTGQSNGGKRDGSGRLISWNGRKVRAVDGHMCFLRPDNEWEKIMFPEPPQWRKAEELPLHLYDAKVEQEYKYMKAHGLFKDGILPDLAPKREWIDWNF